VRPSGVARPPSPAAATMPDVTLARLSWLATVLVCLISSLVSLLAGYQGYAAVLLLVGASAAINLR
jgi:hypothetical protein